jgi:hypothetical protein
MRSGVRWQCHTGGDATTPYEPLLPPSQALTAVCGLPGFVCAEGKDPRQFALEGGRHSLPYANRVLPASMDGRHVLWFVGREVDDAAKSGCRLYGCDRLGGLT